MTITTIICSEQYRSINSNPSLFYNIKGQTMDGTLLSIHDIISITSYSIIGNINNYITVDKSTEHLYYCDKIYNDRLMFAKINDGHFSMGMGSKISYVDLEVIHN